MNIFYKTITIIVFSIFFIAFSSYFDYFIIFDLNKIKIKFGKYLVTKNGMRYSKFSEKNLSEYLKNKEISISIDIGMGNHKWTVYTCDLTEQYIRINADYRS